MCSSEHSAGSARIASPTCLCGSLRVDGVWLASLHKLRGSGTSLVLKQSNLTRDPIPET